MGTTANKERLLAYLSDAIQQESDVLIQKNVIQEYDNAAEGRKPQGIAKIVPTE